MILDGYEISTPKLSKLAKAGHSEKFIADFFQVSMHRWERWKEDYPDFKNILRKATTALTDAVVKTLHKKATGYTEKIVDKDPETGTILGTQQVHSRPDMSAIKFWLTNKEPDEWQDKKAITQDVKQTLTIKTDTKDLEDRLEQLPSKGGLDDALQ